MRRGIDLHGHRPRALAGDLLVELEQVSVTVLDLTLATLLDRVAEIHVDRVARGADAVALVAYVLGRPGGHVARDQVPVARIHLLQEVVALVVRDVVRLALFVRVARNPDPAVVSQRLRHQRQLRLVLGRLRDAGRMKLREAGVGKPGAALVRPPHGGDVAAHGVGRQEVHVGVAAGGEHHRVGRERLRLARDEVAGDDPPGPPVADDDVQHLVTGVRVDLAGPYLPHHRPVGAQQKLLPGLTPAIESALDEHAAERPSRQQAPVLAVERDALGHRLVDDLARELRQPPHVGLPRAEVSALHRVGEQALD